MPCASMSTISSKVFARQIAVRIGAADDREQVVFEPFLGGAHRDDLLREHVERLIGDDERVEVAAPDGEHECRAFDELVARGHEEPALGDRASPVAGATDALQRHGDRARRSDLADEVDRPDVDPQLERGGRHEGAQLAGLESGLRIEPSLAREAPVVRRDDVVAEALGELMAHALGHSSRVDEHERRSMSD